MLMSRTGRGTIWLACVAAVGALAGCRATPPPPRVDGSYGGPPIRLESAGSQHLIVLEAPSGGWTFSLDLVRPTADGHEAFVTVTEPNPAFVYAAQVVEQRIGSTVPSGERIAVYARRLEWGQRAGRRGYELIARGP